MSSQSAKNLQCHRVHNLRRDLYRSYGVEVRFPCPILFIVPPCYGQSAVCSILSLA